MKEETESLVKELIEQTSTAYLATIDKNGLPYIRAVFNLRCPKSFPHSTKIIEEYETDPYTTYISTNTSSIKMKHIRINNNVAIYYCKPGDIKGIMLQGKAEIMEDMEFKKNIWEDNWTIYYPKGYTDPDFTMLKIKPEYIKGWFRGHHIHRIENQLGLH